MVFIKKIVVLIVFLIVIFSCSQSALLSIDDQQLAYADSNSDGIDNILVFDFDVMNSGEVECDKYELKIYMDFENSGESWSQIYTDLEVGQTRHFTIRYDKGAKDLLRYNIIVVNMDEYKSTGY